MSHGQHEKTDAQAKPLVVFVIIMCVIIAFCILITILMWKALESSWQSQNTHIKERVFSRDELDVPIVQVQGEGASELKKLRAYEDKILHSYGWENQEKGIVRVPIDRAMGMMLEKKKFEAQKKSEIEKVIDTILPI